MKALLGDKGWLSEEQSKAYTSDWLGLTSPTVLGVALPISAHAVSEVVKYCHQHRITLTPQGGNTGLVLGSVPAENAKQTILLSLAKLNSIGDVDTTGRTVNVQSGVVLENLQNTLASFQLTLPVHLGSAGSAQIGGLISTNAGGCHAFRDGMMGDQVLGLEVVLPNGELWDGNRALIKDNSGYNLKRMFCGAEGTLGVITAATLQLSPIPSSTHTLLLNCPSLNAAQTIFSQAQLTAGCLLNAAEFIDRIGIEFVKRHCPTVNFPLDEIPAVTLLLEFVNPSAHTSIDELVEHIVEQALTNQWAIDGVIASSQHQQSQMWQLRESIPEGQRLHGPQLKHDVSVPVAKLCDFIETATQRCLAVMPEVMVNPFGHLGDGNVHFNLSAEIGHESQLVDRTNALNDAVYDTVLLYDGSIAAEHGLGRSKVALADKTRSSIERSLMHSLKQAIDPHRIMNPGVIVSGTDEVPK